MHCTACGPIIKRARFPRRSSRVTNMHLKGNAYPTESSCSRWRLGLLSFHLAHDSSSSLFGPRQTSNGRAIDSSEPTVRMMSICGTHLLQLLTQVHPFFPVIPYTRCPKCTIHTYLLPTRVETSVNIDQKDWVMAIKSHSTAQLLPLWFTGLLLSPFPLPPGSLYDLHATLMKISKKIEQSVNDDKVWWSFEYFPPRTAQVVILLLRWVEILDDL